VPFVTAYEGLHRAGFPRAGEAVLVCGANGKVGQAVVQLAARAGAMVIVLVRSPGAFAGHASAPVHEVVAGDKAAERVRELTGGSGAGLVFNTVGSPYFEIANQSMATGAVQVLIATQERSVPFDIFRFYRGQHSYIGIDSLALDATRGAAILEVLRPGFEDGRLRPFPIGDHAVHGLDDALAGYRAVLAGSRERVVLRP
jgi:NADPH2:quinone reductase